MHTAREPTVRDRVDVVLDAHELPKKPIRYERITHDPEQPTLHLEDRNHVPSIQNHIRQEERWQTEGRVEVRAHETERPEETLHRQEGQVRLRNFAPQA